MCIGTFFIVYRVYYQQRRVFRSRRVNQNHALGTAPNKAKGLFYLLFTLNLLYFVLVSPVVLVTTILFRDPDKELAYPRVKAIIYLMQFCNHSLNFIFYGSSSVGCEDRASTLSLSSSRYHVAAVSTDVVRVVSVILGAFASMLSTANAESLKTLPTS